jgi:hypothetical protein
VFTQELHDAHLGQKIEHGLEEAAPHILGWAGHMGLGAVKAFAHGWWDADVWGKSFTVAFLLKKFGVFSKLGGLLFGRGKGVGGALSKLAPTPVYVTNFDKFPGAGGFNRKFPTTSTVARDIEEGAKTGGITGLLGAGAPAAGGLAAAAGIFGLGKLGALSYHSATGRDIRRLRNSLGLLPGTYDPATGHINANLPDLTQNRPSATGRGQRPRWVPSSFFWGDMLPVGHRGPVAFPVLHATATINSLVFLDKVKVADGTKQVELTYSAGGRGH